MKRNNFFKSIVCVFAFIAVLTGQDHGYRGSDHQEENFEKGENKPMDLLNGYTIKIQIWGEVGNPGVHFVPVDASLLDVLSMAGGPLDNAALSRVRLIDLADSINSHTGREVIIDLEDFLQSGKFEIEPILKHDMIIIIPKNKMARFFDSLPGVLNVLNILSVSILLYSVFK